MLVRVKLLQCGDIHIDAPFTSLSDMDGRPEQRRQELKGALSRIIDLAKAEQVDMLLICGDLYEHNYSKKSTIHFICDQFQRIPDIPIIIVPGNHDPLTVDSFYYNWNWPSNVHILDEKASFFEQPHTGVRVYCAFPEKQELDNEWINILAYHGTLDMPFSVDAYKPIDSGDIEACGFDYCALGHFHSSFLYAGSKKRFFNAGSPEPLGFDEEGEHGIIIASIAKHPGEESDVQAVFKRTGKRRFIDLQMQAGNCFSDEQVALKAAMAMEEAGNKDNLYRIFVRGYISHDFKINVTNVTGILKEKAFYVKVIDQTAPDYDFEKIAKEPGLRGVFVRKMLERVENTSVDEEKRLIMKALYYGMEAIDEGRVCI